MLSFEHSGMIIGLNDKVIGQIGVIIIHFISLLIIGPPADIL